MHERRHTFPLAHLHVRVQDLVVHILRSRDGHDAGQTEHETQEEQRKTEDVGHYDDDGEEEEEKVFVPGEKEQE